MGDDIVPPKNLSDTFEQEAKTEHEEPAIEESPKHEEPAKDSVAPTGSPLRESPKVKTPPAGQRPTTPPATQPDSELPGSEEEEDSESEPPLVVVAPPKLLDGKKFQERLRRIFAPRMDGTYKVPEELVRDWKSKSKSRREPIEAMFEKVGCNPDRVS